LRVAVHDFPGHPGQASLSRELARRGHDVLHLYDKTSGTATGAVTHRADDPASLAYEGLTVGRDFPRYSAVSRLRYEHEYAGHLIGRILSFAPDVFVSSNTSLVSQRRLWIASGARGIARVFWLQDFYSVAMRQHLVRRLGAAGRVAGGVLWRLEANLLRSAEAIVAISPDFGGILGAWGVPSDRMHVIENWAPIEELPVRPRDNPWSRAHGLADKRVVLYAGNLGLKHDPALLLEFSRAVRDEPDVRVVVVSRGPGRDWLERQQAEGADDNLVILDYQPYETLPDMLASADVLVALLTSDAGVFSVPSKILTNLCAARPQVAAVPANNLAARTVAASGGGIVIEPGNAKSFVVETRRLLADDDLRRQMGESARRYAEDKFRIDAVTSRFEDVLAAALQTGSPNRRLA